MLSPKAKRNVYRIIPFGLMWLIFSIVYILVEKGLLGNLTYYPSTGNPYNFQTNLVITPLAALLCGLLIGTIEIVYLNKLFLQSSLTRKIIYKTIIYKATIIFFLVLLSAIANSREPSTSFLDKDVWSNTLHFVFSYSFLSVAIYIAAIIIVTQFYNEVSDNIGQVVLTNFFTGKYHSPREEERIFMFLDMKSSTTIAEHLGHVMYFEMLKDYYADLSDPIVTYSGEIYQYVGDEIVVSWKVKNGIQHHNCVRCFFEMKEAIKKRYETYIQKFGIAPQFKAGLHMGKVTTGELGILRKEIIFTGDVLNTTARVQGLCNHYDVDILISRRLIKELDLGSEYKVKSLGENELRGRGEKIELLTIMQ
jgi:class 3 adenylate cyclase